MASFFCEFCNFSCQLQQESQFYKHLRTSHSNEPNFQVYCSYENCNRTFTKVKSLQKHWQRQHRLDNTNDHIQPEEDILPNDTDQEFNEEASKKTLQHHTAKFLLGAKEDGKISQKALGSVKESTQALCGEYLENVKKVLEIKLRADNPQFIFTEDMESLFDSENLFEGLETEFKQRAYYLKNFNLVVSVCRAKFVYNQQSLFAQLSNRGFYWA